MAFRPQDLAVHTVLVLASLCCQLGAAFPYFAGGCPNVESTPYDATTLSGVWYEARRTPNLVEGSSSCVAWNITETSPGTLGVVTSLKYALGTKTMTSTLVQEEGSSNADFSFTVDKLPGLFFGLPASRLQVVALTTEYLVAFSCSTEFFGWKSTQLLWVLTADQVAADTVVGTAVSEAAARGINTARLQVVTQTDC